MGFWDGFGGKNFWWITILSASASVTWRTGGGGGGVKMRYLDFPLKQSVIGSAFSSQAGFE